MRHDFYKTGDADAPTAIKDRNGEVVLQMCRTCHRAEIELVGRDECSVPVVLSCPKCGHPHIDEESVGWKNPPHRSHLCINCEAIWRPSDTCTEGVRRVFTAGKSDNWTIR